MPGLIQRGFWQWAEHYAAGSHKRTATDCQSAVKSARWETTSSSPQGKALDRNRWGGRERENEKENWDGIRGTNSGADTTVLDAAVKRQSRVQVSYGWRESNFKYEIQIKWNSVRGWTRCGETCCAPERLPTACQGAVDSAVYTCQAI